MSWPNCPPLRREAHYGERIVTCFRDRPASVDALLREAAQAWPEREALVDSASRYSFRDLDKQVDRVAAGLQAIGIAAGDRIAVLLGNCAEFVWTVLAAARIGAVTVPLNTRQQAPEIAYHVSDCGAVLLVHDAALAERLPEPGASDLRRIAVGGVAAGSAPFETLLECSASPQPVAIAEEAPAFILYTSGTTGRPKGAVLTNFSTVTSVLHFQICWELTEEDRCMVAVPVSHVTGLVALLLTMIRVGGASILLDQFKAERFLALMAAERATYTLLVPAMYNLCLLQAEIDGAALGAWRIGGYGGGPMPVATLETLAKKLPNLKLACAYGATETSSPATLMRPGEAAARGDTVGQVLPCAEIRIMDDDGREVAPGDSGEVWIGGAQTTVGYWGNPEATKAGFTAGFWHSGDIGSIDADGYLRIFDRKKDMINRAGFKVYSAEVENVLAHHPAVGEVAVVGVPDAVLGEKVCAVIFPKAAAPTAEEIRAYCRARLSDYKVPDFVRLVDAPLPRNANGKIVKRALRPDA